MKASRGDRALSRLRWGATLAAALLLALGVAACGTGDSGGDTGSESEGGVSAGPGVDPASKTITVGTLTDLSGAVAVLGKPFVDGIQTYVEALNAKGGVDGWKLQYVTKDSGYEPEKHVRLYNEVKDEVALLHSVGSGTTKAIQGLLDQDKLVTIPLSWDSVWGDDPVLAPVGTPYAYDMANALSWVVDERGAKDRKFGIIYQDDEYGADGLRGYEAAVETEGLDDVAQASYKVEDTDFTAQVQRMKSAGAEVVALVAVPSSTPQIIGTADSLGYKPTWVLLASSFIEQAITEDGTPDGKRLPTVDAMARDSVVASFAAQWGDMNQPGMKQFLADQRKYAPDQIPSVYFMYGYSQAKVAAAILEKAIANGDLSREGILDAKLNLGAVDLGGLTPDVTYTPQGGPPSRASILNAIDPDEVGFLKPLVTEFESEAADSIGGGS